MDALECIFTRRSIRRFKDDKPVEDEKLDQIIEAGMNAPSAMNEQPWEFLVLKDKKHLEKITEISKYASMSKYAGAGILVCGNMDHKKFYDYWVQDLSACVQNMLLAIRALELGGVWTGVYPQEKVMNGFKKLFKLPENIVPFAFIVLGYPDREQERVDRFDKSRVHVGKW